ncbi:MAG: DUF512 domain-containing protein [Desulfuromonadaceae bacterium]|nr:DUF512 domain-containing protein [Desulfuromonadaceae bacterium]
MLHVTAVQAHSIADELQIDAGDCLLTLQGQEVNDVVDYCRLTKDDECLVLEVQKEGSGEVWELEIERDGDEALGLEFSHPQPKHCSNNCQFCFVRQQPEGMRSSLYVRDDDYRFSYLYGSYITLTNLKEPDFARITAQQLSPLYVSVHATDPAVRNRLLGNQKAPAVLPLLQRLAQAGIVLHTQVVLCPGLNDGSVLDQTIRDLYALAPAVASLAVVPVGLTRYRDHLPHLQPVGRQEAGRILSRIHAFQKQYLLQCGSRFVFAADELYQLAGQPVPDVSCYEKFDQIENGVGLLAQFRADADEVLEEADPAFCHDVKVTLVTGCSAGEELQRFVTRFNERCDSQLQVAVIENHFWGSLVTVAGLLTGQDMTEQLSGIDLGCAVLLPDVMFREQDDLLLDGLSREELSIRLGVPVLRVPASPWGILDAVEAIFAQN